MRALFMRIIMLALVTGAAWAQAPAPGAGPSATSGSDAGPFPPLPNGEVAITKVPEAEPAPASVQPNVAVVPAPPSPQAIEAQALRERVAEEQLDRAEREHERAREEATRNAGTIEGAYSGLTGERDR